MKIQFLGAAQSVTGSCFVIETKNARFAVDCGMHQGSFARDERNFESKIYQPASLDFILLTHAHIDHSGLLPRLVADGFNKPIYATPPTIDLVGLLLEDSAHIQEMEAEYKRKKLARRNEKNDHVKPLYTIEDAHKSLEFFDLVNYEESFSPAEGIQVTYRDAGHILGSAFIELIITEDEKTSRLIFSGDIGRPGTLLMHDPQEPHCTDYLFLESTYGNRDHKNEELTLDEMAEAIAYSVKHNEKILIPAFAVGRTQEILYCLYQLDKQGRLPKNLPIYLDSPLAIKATKVFSKFMTYLDAPDMDDPLKLLPNLKFSQTVEESQAINNSKGSAIVISASGMCNAGRIKHHIRHNAWKPGASIIFVGFQAMGTPGRRIVDGAESIRFFNEDIAIKAKIFTINGFSAHAGQSQLLEWIEPIIKDDLQIVLIHGEYEAQKDFAACIKERYGLSAHIPDYLEEMTLRPSPEALPAGPAPSEIVNLGRPVHWDFVLENTERKMQRLKEILDQAESLPLSQQRDLRDRVLHLNQELLSILSEF